MGYRYTAFLLGGGGDSSASGNKRGATGSTKKSTTAAAEPKKRGRPPKKETSATTRKPKETTAAAPLKGTTLAANEPPAPAKRGRPRKTSTEQHQEQHQPNKKPRNIPPAALNEASGSTSTPQAASMVKSKIVRRAKKAPVAEQSLKTTTPRPISPKPLVPNTAIVTPSSSLSSAKTAPSFSVPSKIISKKPQRKPTKPLPLLSSQYKLGHVLKGHVETDDLTDQANIWACEFEPESQELVAIAGSNMILFLNVQQARYIKKYTHVETKEEFKCLAWTLLKGPQELLDDNASEDSKCTVLAAAGRLGSIKLVNALQNQCFRHLFGHEKQVRKLQFSKTTKRWLLSASDDMTVRLWDVGAPNNNQENTSMCLAKFVVPPSASIPTGLCAYDGDIIVGCAEGQLVKYKAGKIKGDGDAGVIKHKELYPSGDEWHEGYIDDVCILGQQETGSHALDGCIVSRGSDDYETLIWRPKKSTKKDADIAISLDWPESAEQEGLRFKVVEKDDHKVLVAGDYDGQIRIYNFGDGRLSRTLEDNSKEVFPATKVLSHPMSSKLIRDVTISEDTRTIVAVDSANNVFVWKCT